MVEEAAAQAEQGREAAPRIRAEFQVISEEVVIA